MGQVARVETLFLLHERYQLAPWLLTAMVPLRRRGARGDVTVE